MNNKTVLNRNDNMSELCFSPIRRKLFIREEIEDLTTARKLVNQIVIHQNYDKFGCSQNSLNDTWIQTPMEVDDSDDHCRRCSKKKLEINETNQSDVRPIEEYYKNKMSQGKSGNVYRRRAIVLGAKTFTKVLWALIFCLIISLFYFMTVGYSFASVYKKLDLESLRLELEHKVLSQRVAIADIVHNFERVDSWMQKVKIMPFVGSSGVGKSFTANIVMKHFDRRVVFRLEGFSFKDPNTRNLVLESIVDVFLNLIFIDELDISQLDSFLKFVKQLSKLNKKVLVIPVFNIQERTKFDGTFKIDENAFRHIRNELDSSGLYFEVILFHTLNNSTLKNYVRNELVMHKIDSTKHDLIIDSFVWDKNVEYNGLKGISHRLSIFIYKIRKFLSDH